MDIIHSKWKHFIIKHVKCFPQKPESHMCHSLGCNIRHSGDKILMSADITKSWILFYVAFCILRQYRDRRKPEAGTMPYFLFRMTLRAPYSAQYHRQHCTPHAFEQFGALYMHNHDDKYSRFEPDTSRLQASVDANEPSGPATCKMSISISLWGRRG